MSSENTNEAPIHKQEDKAFDFYQRDYVDSHYNKEMCDDIWNKTLGTLFNTDKMIEEIKTETVYKITINGETKEVSESDLKTLQEELNELFPTPSTTIDEEDFWKKINKLYPKDKAVDNPYEETNYPKPLEFWCSEKNLFNTDHFNKFFGGMFDTKQS